VSNCRNDLPVRVAIFVLLLTVFPLPGRVWSQAPSTADAAWAALKAGDADKAARLFRQALSASPSDPLLLLGAGIAAHDLGDDRQAETALRKALKIRPRLTPASALLGRIVYDNGDLDQAIDIYDRALKGVVDEPEMHDQLERWRKEAQLHAGFEHGGNGRFAIMFEGPEERALADHVSGILETAYWTIGQRLNAYPSNTLEVILYTQRHFTEVTRSPDWAAGAYDGRIRLPVDGALNNQAALDRVVVHELAHAMVQTLAPRGVPAWLHEGLAVSFEPGEKPWVRQTLGQSSTIIPLDSLKSGFTGLSSAEAQVAYAESAVAAGIIMKRLGPNLSAFLQGLESTDSVDAGLTSFGFTVADLERSIRAELRQ
jgi:peptidase MA superfamily protein/tetratricopeptide repeat protein